MYWFAILFGTRRILLFCAWPDLGLEMKIKLRTATARNTAIFFMLFFSFKLSCKVLVEGECRPHRRDNARIQNTVPDGSKLTKAIMHVSRAERG